MQPGYRKTSSDALRAGHRVIRHVGPPDVPWPGMLVRNPDETACVFVDVAALGEDWSGWYADQDGHVLAPRDVVRRPDGHDVALPVCTERLDAFLARRGHDRDRLEVGEVITLAVSLLRGAAELAALRDDADAPPEGEWWITDDGRPAVAPDLAGATASELLASLSASADARLARALAAAASVAADPRSLLRDIDECEAALFAIADPQPLVTQVFSPLRVRDARLGATEVESAGPPARWVDSLARHVDADLTALVSDTVTRVWRRLRRPRRGSRRRPWLVAATIAGGVLGVGLLWPAGGGPATAGGSPAPSAASSAPAAPAAGPVSPPLPDATGGGGDHLDWKAAAAGLLSARAACSGRPACLADILEDPAKSFPAGVSDRGGADLTLTVLDEFGGAAVLRAEDATDAATPPQLIVLVRTQDRVLLRDIHDVAQKKA